MNGVYPGVSSENTKWTTRDSLSVVLSAVLLLVWVAAHHGVWSYLVPPAIFATVLSVAAFYTRAVSLSGALAGAAVFICVTRVGVSIWTFAAMVLLTGAATALASRRKQKRTAGERDGIQVLANTGAAALAAAFVELPLVDSDHSVIMSRMGFAAVLAILAEATADTVSSEIGKAFGGAPRLITSGRMVPSGTNGAVSLKGTVAGAIATAAFLGCYFLQLWWPPFGAVTSRAAVAIGIIGGAALAGMLMDSLLGATLEPRYLNNDAVNLLSTCFAAALACALLLAFGLAR